MRGKKIDKREHKGKNEFYSFIESKYNSYNVAREKEKGPLQRRGAPLLYLMGGYTNGKSKYGGGLARAPGE